LGTAEIFDHQRRFKKWQKRKAAKQNKLKRKMKYITSEYRLSATGELEPRGKLA
jgi:hypothetical protein